MLSNSATASAGRLGGLVVYHAEPGTDSAAALGLLGSIAATAERDNPTNAAVRRFAR